MNLTNPSPAGYVTMDATRSVSVHLSNKDIADGIAGDPENCAIAIALTRSLRKSEKRDDITVRVFRTTVWVGHDDAATGERVVELFDLDGNGRNLVASMDTTKTAYPVVVTILPRTKGKQREAIVAKNVRRAQRIAAGVAPDPKYHSAGGAKGAARTLAGIRSGSATSVAATK